MGETTATAVQQWAKELDELGERIGKRFARSEPRHRVVAYLRGLLSPVERKNSWQLAEELGEQTPYGVQHLLGRARWEAEAVRDDLRAYVVEHLGEKQAVLIVDETGFVKKGEQSVGVQRQYSGTAGRIENCQIGVFLAYASPQGRTFLDRALYLPEEWAQDKLRCHEAGVPKTVGFATKPVLAQQMIARALAARVPARGVTGDSVYGNDGKLRRWLEEQGVAHVLGVSGNHYIWMELRQQQVATVVPQVPRKAWQRLSAGNGSKGPRWFDWAALRLPCVERGWQRWLLLRRKVDKPAEIAYYRVFARACTPPSSNNTATGASALSNSTTGEFNTATGFYALTNNTAGAYNTAAGAYTLFKNTTSAENTAIGGGALQNTTTGGNNTAVGFNTLSANTAGYTNSAFGNGAGAKLTDGHDNVYLGHEGAAVESNTLRLGQTQTTTFIAGVTGTPVVGSQVLITSDGQLGTLASSTRYKRDIQDMGERSRKLQQLCPVTFRYRQDQQGVQQYGLIAEEVAQIYPELVMRNANGEVETIQYHELIPMLLNEHQHQEQEIQELKAQNVRQQQEIGALKTAILQQNAMTAARLTQLEAAARTATVASR